MSFSLSRHGDHGVLVPQLARRLDAAHPAGRPVRACGLVVAHQLPRRRGAGRHRGKSTVSRAVDFRAVPDMRCPASGCHSRSSARPIDEDGADRVVPIRRRDPQRPRPIRCRCGPRSGSRPARFDRRHRVRLALGGHTVRASVRGLCVTTSDPGGSIVMPRDVFVRQYGDTRAHDGGDLAGERRRAGRSRLTHPGGACNAAATRRWPCRARSGGCHCVCSIGRLP